MKLWRTRDEWTRYANCHDSIDHTLPAVRTEEDADKPVANVGKVIRACNACRVRPESRVWGLGKTSRTHQQRYGSLAGSSPWTREMLEELGRSWRHPIGGVRRPWGRCLKLNSGRIRV
jgi:hypothetical protein